MMGRLRGAPDPLLAELLYEPVLADDREKVLPHLLRVDAAHVLMLAARGIIPAGAAGQLLALNHEITERMQAGAPTLFASGPHRGLYWLYEQELIRRLGPEVGGAAHAARSRNDINATVARLRAREEVLLTLEALVALLAAAITLAGEHAAALMSGFTHLQPAQPTTLGHYLAGVASELARSGRWLAAVFEVTNRSPMGAAAGAGTSFPIDSQQVAQYLGFAGAIPNSLDAVASRDYLAQLLAAAAMLGSTLTRLGGDLQLWSSHAYGFLGWPDELVSTSSIMPQKRNAFVLEHIRGCAVRPAAALVDVLMALKNTPYANSVEVSAEATSPAWPALAALRKALRLTTLLLQRLVVFAERMRAFVEGSQITMTALADCLVARHQLAFRVAHDAVGTLLREQPEGSALDAAEVCSALEGILAAATGRPLELDRLAVAAALDPAHGVAAARHGGGPAPASVHLQLRGLAADNGRLRERAVAWRREIAAADHRLTAAVAEACAGHAAPAAGSPAGARE